MHWNEYQNWVVDKLRKDLTQEELLTNMALGLAGEGGECADLVKKHVFHGKPLDKTKLAKEIGDALFYAAALAAVAEIQFTDVVTANVLKLDARYPNGFDVSRAHSPGETPIEDREERLATARKKFLDALDAADAKAA